MIELPGDLNPRRAARSGTLAWRDAPVLPLWDTLVVALVVMLAVAATVMHGSPVRLASPESSAGPRVEPASAPRMRIGAAQDGPAADAEQLPMVTVAPVYPRVAQQQRIEGRCTVEYTIAATGAVQSVRARTCVPAGVFEQAAIEAARQFKYRPRIRGGAPVAVQGVRNEFVFALAR